MSITVEKEQIVEHILISISDLKLRLNIDQCIELCDKLATVLGINYIKYPSVSVNYINTPKCSKTYITTCPGISLSETHN